MTTTMHPRLATLLFLISPLVAQETREQKVGWLQDHLAKDLSGLGAMIGEARVVCLGEANHGDGTTFERKVEICRFLHQKLGFSVLVFESGFYECHKAWQEVRAGGKASDAARRAVFPVWSSSAQVAPLWRYITTSSVTEKPLELAGFDFQPSGVHTKTQLLGEVKAAVSKLDGDVAKTAIWSDVAKVYDLVQAGKGAELRRFEIEVRPGFHESSVRLADLLSKDAPFLAQVVRSQSKFMRFLWNIDFRKPDPKVFNLREEQGAENLLWMLQHLYEGRKVIVWGATSHLSRNRQRIETESAPKMVPVGHHLAERLGKKVFMLGFVAHHGSACIARAGARAFKIPEAPADSFAGLLAATTHDGGYLDLRAATWLQEKRVARPMGHTSMRANWSEVVDAFCFIREMRPSTLPRSPDAKKK